MSVINYSDIETFLAIAETKSLSNAAEKLFLSQSTISYRLNSLEQNLGVKLILRDKGKSIIALTAKGEEFIKIAQMWKALHKSTNEWKEQPSAYKLRIASVDTLNTCIFPELYKKLFREISSLFINVSTHWTVSIHRFIENYEADIGFALWEIPSQNIITKPLFIEPLVLISPPDSQFDLFMRPRDLDPQKEIYFYSGPNFRQWHDYWWHNEEKENTTVDTVALLKIFIKSTGFWSIVPLSVAKTLKNTYPLIISDLTDPPPNRICYQITNRHRLPRSQKSLELFEEYLADFINSKVFLDLIK